MVVGLSVLQKPRRKYTFMVLLMCDNMSTKRVEKHCLGNVEKEKL